MVTAEIFRQLIAEVNTKGFGALNLETGMPGNLGEKLYMAMDHQELNAKRSAYYNEVAFYWPEDWREINEGLLAFHSEATTQNIFPADIAAGIFTEKLGKEYSDSILEFSLRIKKFILQAHHGLSNNKIRLSRVMVRQMSESDCTLHGGAADHEDIGYGNRSFRHLLSAVITTYGIPTHSLRHDSKVNELLIFNAFHRRELLGLPAEMAFVHRGPKSGPKMLFFFEFLGSAEN